MLTDVNAVFSVKELDQDNLDETRVIMARVLGVDIETVYVENNSPVVEMSIGNEIMPATQYAQHLHSKLQSAIERASIDGFVLLRLI